MKITNQRPYPVEIAATGDVVAPGETVEVDDDLGKRLCEQADAWSKPTSRKAEKNKDD